MDFIFALPNQTFEDLKADVDAAFQSGANHVAIYPFIDFTFTPSTVTTMPKKGKAGAAGCHHPILYGSGIHPQLHLDFFPARPTPDTPP